MKHKESDTKLWQEPHVSPRCICGAAHSA